MPPQCVSQTVRAGFQTSGLYLVLSLFLGSCMHASQDVQDSDLEFCYFLNVQYVFWIKGVTSPVSSVAFETFLFLGS